MMLRQRCKPFFCPRRVRPSALLMLLFAGMTFFGFNLLLHHFIIAGPSSAFERIDGARHFTLPPSSSCGLESDGAWPKRIWQTWKTPLVNSRTLSWKSRNPGYEYRLLTDAEATAWVDTTFSREEEAPLRATYHAMNDPVLKADLLRYLLIYAEGGVYTDLDTTALRPIAEWIPRDMVDAAKVNLVVGVEVDEPNASAFEVWRWAWASRFHLCQWTFMARPCHPILGRAVEQVVREMSERAEREGRSVADLRPLTRQEVLATTGPQMWTQVILSYLSDLTKTKVDWYNMTGLQAPKLIGDVLIMPVTAFGPNQRHSGSLPRTDKQALSFHHFGMSAWTKTSGRDTWMSWFGF